MKDMEKENSPSILVISGNPMEIVILKAELEISGFRDSVFTASCSEEAFRIAAERSPALAIYEHPLDSEDGIILSRTLRREYTVPVLVLGKQEAAEQVGAEAFLPSPYVFQDFLHIVQRLVSPPAALFSKKAEGPKRLEEEEHKYQDLFDRASDIILLMDYDTHLIIDANKQAELAYGYTREELIGMSLLQMVPREQHISILQNTKRIAKEGVLHHLGKRTHIKKDGTPIQVSISASLIEYGGRKVFQDIVRDETERIKAEETLKRLNEELARANIEIQQEIAERKQAEEELEKHAVKLDAANKELEAFSYSVSHDLRAPLRAIDGFGQALIEDCGDQLDDEGKRLLEVVRKNTRHMGQLIDDLLAFSRTGRQTMGSTKLNIGALIKTVCEQLQVLAPERQLRFEIKRLPPAYGDWSMIHQVWMNLLSNAVKFTRPVDSPVIEVGGTSEENENIYYVKDNGAGFDMKYVDKLFGVFQRLHSASDFEGTGVGLALVQRIIDRHGGRVWAEGQVNKGAAFYFTLPKNEGDFR